MDNTVSNDVTTENVDGTNGIGWHTQIDLVGNSDVTESIDKGDFVILANDNTSIAAFLIKEKPYGVIFSNNTTAAYRATVAHIMRQLGYKSSLKTARVGENIIIEKDSEVKYLRDPRIERIFPQSSQLPAS